MQIVIDLPDSQVQTLLHCAGERGITSSELISKALRSELEPTAREGDQWVSQYAGLRARTNPDEIVDAQKNTSNAGVVSDEHRRAKSTETSDPGSLSSFIGMLAENNPYGDGLEYQESMRSEWQR